MDDGLLAMTELIQPVTLVITMLVGWFVKSISKSIKEQTQKIESLRTEMHQELKEYTRTETCCAYRGDLQKQIDTLRHELTVMTEINGYCMPSLHKQVEVAKFARLSSTHSTHNDYDCTCHNSKNKE